MRVIALILLTVIFGYFAWESCKQADIEKRSDEWKNEK